MAPKPLDGANNDFPLPGNGSEDMICPGDYRHLLDFRSSSMEEITGVRNRDSFVHFRMDDESGTFVARDMANGLNLQDVFHESWVEFPCVVLESPGFTRNLSCLFLDEVA